VLTYSETRGWLVAPDEAWAQVISVARQEFVVLATPAFTATMPNAWPEGSTWPHCGYDTSFPVGVLAADAAAAGTITKVARTIPAIMPDLIDQPLSGYRSGLRQIIAQPAHRRAVGHAGPAGRDVVRDANTTVELR